MGSERSPTNEDWVPLRARHGEVDGYLGPHEGVPAWLVTSLLSWVREALTRVGENSGQRRAYIERMERRLRQWALLESPGMDEGQEVAEVVWRAQGNQECLLDVVDYLLDNPPAHLGAWEATGPDSDWLYDSLEGALREAGSVWTVHTSQGHIGLARRVSTEVQSLVASATSGDDPAGSLLGQAWLDAFGRHPDPDDAYITAVKAVEAAAKVTISPRDSSATLTKMAHALADNPSKWSLVLTPEQGESPVTIADILKLLMSGHDGRHGSETLEEIHPCEGRSRSHPRSIPRGVVPKRSHLPQSS